MTNLNPNSNNRMKSLISDPFGPQVLTAGAKFISTEKGLQFKAVDGDIEIEIPFTRNYNTVYRKRVLAKGHEAKICRTECGSDIVHYIVLKIR